MEKKVIKTIKRNNLIEPGDTVVVGVSGGADSMALLNILIGIKKMYGFDIVAAHINHGLREAAYSEAEYVKNYCARKYIPFCTTEVNVKSMAKSLKLTEEQAGRKARYSFFYEVMKKYNASKLATAHHKNDNAETVMLHLIRGSGIGGLCGIRYKRENIIRPLLDVTRAEIESYCKTHNIVYCSDETNFSTEYTRNKLRIVTIPHIEQEYNKNFVDTLSRLSVIAEENEDFIKCYSKTIYDTNVVDDKLSIKYAQGLPNAVLRCVIKYMIKSVYGKDENISFVHVDSALNLIRNGFTGKSVDLLDDIRAVVEYDTFKIEKKHYIKDFQYQLMLNETVYVKEAGLYITMIESEKGFEIDDLEKVFVTNRKPGDVFYPEGMTGKKKLKDFFIDIKLPVCKRDIVPVIRYNNDILCVGDIRRDRRYLKNKGVLFKFEKRA